MCWLIEKTFGFVFSFFKSSNEKRNRKIFLRDEITVELKKNYQIVQQLLARECGLKYAHNQLTTIKWSLFKNEFRQLDAKVFQQLNECYEELDNFLIIDYATFTHDTNYEELLKPFMTITNKHFEN